MTRAFNGSTDVTVEIAAVFDEHVLRSIAVADWAAGASEEIAVPRIGMAPHRRGRRMPAGADRKPLSREPTRSADARPPQSEEPPLLAAPPP